MNLPLTVRNMADRLVRWGLLGILLGVAGCGNPKPSTPGELRAFEMAGPLRPAVDIDQLLKARTPSGPYRLVVGDVLELHIPRMMREVAPEQLVEAGAPFLARVSGNGKITLPIAGELPVAGKTLIEVEAAVARAYYPKYAVRPPIVVAQVAQYSTEAVSVVGGVERPGVYPLRRDEMSLVNALMKAGGIVKDGAAVIQVRHAAENVRAEPVMVPVKGLNVPFADVALKEGDSIEVVKLNPEYFTVVGLVRSPGAFPYPAGTRFNLMQALAFAGGMNHLADPRFVRVYRQAADGEVVAATFSISGTQQTDAPRVQIRPGDVVAVEQDDRTSLRLLMAEIVRVHLGVNLAGLYRQEWGRIRYDN